jgi:hypothetical protein
MGGNTAPKPHEDKQMTTETINYYVFDSIAKDYDNQYWGHKNGNIAEVFVLSSEDESLLIQQGFAKCDAPDWPETMLVEESAWAALESAWAALS